MKNTEQLYSRVEELPCGPEWTCKEYVQEGDLKDSDGNPLVEKLEVWYRDPVECIKEIIGNPIFAQHLAFAPERVFRDPNGKERHIDEMWTADWWWDIQVSILI